jgi:hypothetical protein
MVAYAADKHKPVVHAKCFPPYPNTETHGEEDPSQGKQDNRAIVECHSISSDWNSTHLYGTDLCLGRSKRVRRCSNECAPTGGRHGEQLVILVYG